MMRAFYKFGGEEKTLEQKTPNWNETAMEHTYYARTSQCEMRNG